ncbi:hypothetical protein Hanom_Chr06g00525671 [Helianthus anomalus]
MSVEIPTVVHIRWNRLQPQLAPRNSLLMILTKFPRDSPKVQTHLKQVHLYCHVYDFSFFFGEI